MACVALARIITHKRTTGQMRLALLDEVRTQPLTRVNVAGKCRDSQQVRRAIVAARRRSQSDFRRAQLSQLVAALASSTSVRTLDVRSNHLDDTAVGALAHVLTLPHTPLRCAASRRSALTTWLTLERFAPHTSNFLLLLVSGDWNSVSTICAQSTRFA